MKKTALCFVMGGSIYCMMEICARGKTHISMFFAGGASLALIHKICYKLLKEKGIFVKCLCGGAIITLIEYLTGLLVNVKMKLQVFDYSDMPLNVKGQICPRFTAIWSALTYPALLICRAFIK